MKPRPLHPWDDRPASGNPLPGDSPPKPLAPAYVYAAERDWPGYFAAVAGLPPRDTLLAALAAFDAERSASPPPPGPPRAGPPHAVDLGSGEGRDTAELLRRGWRVTAIDGHPEALERLMARPDLHAPDVISRHRLAVRQAMLEGLEVPPADLVNASFALPFCLPDRFGELWASIVRALPPGGRFAGQLFGDRDDWAFLPDRTHHSRAEVEELLRPFEIEMLREEEKEASDPAHPKHWHVFHVVARRRAPPSS